MDRPKKELSLKFYSFLCDIIGTKEVVNKRRQIFAVQEDCIRYGGDLLVSSGSKAEGLDLKGSDFDEMIVVNFAQVFEQLKHVKNRNKTLSLIMDTENVKPGFTKLWVHHPSCFGPRTSDYIDWRIGRPYFSSTLFRQMMCNETVQNDYGFYMHGPCSTSPDGMVDHAFSLYCADWISQALPWINRTKYSWASDEVIRKILCFGSLFVPIGSKHSPNTDLEWRISFSYAEKQLIVCFNHIQLLCYALLKILLNDIIKKSFEDLLCSYFMKTIMFWLCEETDIVFWRTENMLLCFMTCFRRLIYCVENETCLHYFIPENNLFENRFEKQHKKLLSKLHELYDLGWMCLLQTETLRSFNGYLEPSSLSMITLSTFLPCMKFLGFPWYDIADDAAIIKRCIFQSFKSKKRDIYMCSLSRICQCSAQKTFNKASVQGSTKVLYRNLRRSLSNLLIGVNHDAVSGWLLLASFFFTNKQYNISKTLIDYSLAKLTPDRCELFRENNLWQLRRYNEIDNVVGLRCLKHYTINRVMFWKYSDMIPVELKSLIKTNSYIKFPPTLYAHFLNCLFYCTNGDYRMAETSCRRFLYYSERYMQYVKSS